MKLDLPSAFLVGFAHFLREAGCRVSTEQSITFLSAIGALGPRDLSDIRRAALAVFGPGPDRQAEFHALFDQYFLRKMRVARIDERCEADAHCPGESPDERRDVADLSESPGELASARSINRRRSLEPLDDSRVLRRFSRIAAARLSRRMTRRTLSARRGRQPDRLRTMREATRTGGEVLTLRRRRRREKLRPIVLLIDISGSMKMFTDNAMRFAHALAHLPTKVEIFALGTQLTRITSALRLRSEVQALQQVSHLIHDLDGGTRLGAGLQSLLAIPRFASQIRGSVVVTLSDGLEIGNCDLLASQARRLYRLSFAHLWLTPLAENDQFVPQTEALMRISPYIDDFGSAKSISRICSKLLGETQTAEAK